jgi:hypothetical protein
MYKRDGVEAEQQFEDGFHRGVAMRLTFSETAFTIAGK